MTAGIIIVSIIAAFALYDYFSTKNWQLVTSDSRNDTVFEKRNKKYGAYQIRRNYNTRMILILLGLTGGIGGLYAATQGLYHRKPKTTGGVIVTMPAVAEVEDKDDEVVEEKQPEKTQELVAQSRAISFTEFKITQNTQDTATLNIPDGNTDLADKDLKGNGNEFGDPVDVPDEPKGPELIKDNDGIVMNVDEAAYFIGGDEAQMKFMRKIANPAEGAAGTSKIKFVVTKDGSIGKAWVKVKAKGCPECDEEALRIVKAMPKWEPGKVNGIPVDSYFTIPITFR